MIFRFEADAVFEADNVDDALRKIGMHFISLVVGDEEMMVQFLAGEIVINPYISDGSFPYIDESPGGGPDAPRS